MTNISPYRPPQTSPYSLVTVFCVTIVSPLGANPHPPGPKARLSILLYLISGRYTIPSGLISMSLKSSGCCNMSACSFVNGEEDRPWKDRVQSTCLSSSLRTGGGSSRPSVRERSGSDSSDGESSCWTCCAFADASDCCCRHIDVELKGRVCRDMKARRGATLHGASDRKETRLAPARRDVDIFMRCFWQLSRAPLETR